MKRAKSSDWQTEALPLMRSTIRLGRLFSPEEIVRIKKGIVPEEMEDKWFIYWKKDSLYFHRSWTGYCVYAVRFDAEGDGFRMTEASVNRDPKQYKETSDHRDAALISYLVDTLLLHKEAVYPSGEASPEKQALEKWSLVGKAMHGEHSNDEQIPGKARSKGRTRMIKDKRTKQGMARDLAYILQSPLHCKSKRALIKNVVWAWTTSHGKYKGCRYRTPAAADHIEQYGKKGLIHEHAVPIKLIRAMLLQMDAPQEEEVYKLLDRLAVGVVETVDEQEQLDSEYKTTMPSEFDDEESGDYRNPLLRFKVCGVEVVENPDWEG